MTAREVKVAMKAYAAWRQRGIPPITDAQLDQFLADALDVAKKELLAERCLEPFARLIVPGPLDRELVSAVRVTIVSEGPLPVIQFPLNLDNDVGRRNRQFQIVRLICESLAALAVIIVSDAWTLRDNKTKSLRISSRLQAFLDEHGTVATARAGKGILTEVITASIQTKHKMITKAIPYERVLKGGAVLSQNGQNPLGTEHTIRVLDEDAQVLRIPEDAAVTQDSRMVILYEGEPHAG